MVFPGRGAPASGQWRGARAALGAACLAALTLTACGGGGGGGSNVLGSTGGGSTGNGVSITTPSQSYSVTAQDTYRYAPMNITVKEGTELHFTVTNGGQMLHEFVVGDQALQDAHETQMQAMYKSMPGMTMVMPDDSHGVELKPGQTKTLNWIAVNQGSFQFACHQPGHYAAGMIGHISVVA